MCKLLHVFFVRDVDINFSARDGAMRLRGNLIYMHARDLIGNEYQ